MHPAIAAMLVASTAASILQARSQSEQKHPTDVPQEGWRSPAIMPNPVPEAGELNQNPFQNMQTTLKPTAVSSPNYGGAGWGSALQMVMKMGRMAMGGADAPTPQADDFAAQVGNFAPTATDSVQGGFQDFNIGGTPPMEFGTAVDRWLEEKVNGLMQHQFG